MTNNDMRVADPANFGLTATRTILQNQVRLLRFWADNIERFARIYESETERLKSEVEQAPRAQAAE